MTGFVPWPTPEEYDEAIQKPLLNLNDPDLRDATVVSAVTGNFASVYHIRCNSGPWAVRCFLRNFPDHQERYAAIGAHLDSAKPRYFAGFHFLEKGIRVHREWYPILKMEWIEGQNLRDYIEENISAPPAISALADRWVSLLRTLRKHDIAHGDLQHGNILISRGDFRLVDYDAMAVPALAGYASNEVGHRNYQHPARSVSDFGIHLDNFSGWSIYLTLLALSIEPGLWAEFGKAEDHLLFRREDFEDPGSSRLFQSMEQLKHERIQKYLPLFRSFLDMELSSVPSPVDVVEIKSKKREAPRAAKQTLPSESPEVQLDLFGLSKSAVVTPAPIENIPAVIKPSMGPDIFHFTHSCMRERVMLAFYAGFVFTILTLTASGTIPVSGALLVTLAGFACFVALLTCSYMSLREVRGKLQVWFALESRRGVGEMVRRSLVAFSRFINWLDAKEARDGHWFAARMGDCTRREKRRIAEVKSTLDAFMQELYERRAGLSKAEIEETAAVLSTLQIRHSALLQEGSFLVNAPEQKLEHPKLRGLRSWRARVQELARMGPPIVLPEEEQAKIRQKYEIERRAVQESERFALQGTQRKIESIHVATKRYHEWIDFTREQEHVWFERCKQRLKAQIEKGTLWLEENQVEMKACIAELYRYREIRLSRYLPRLFGYR